MGLLQWLGVSIEAVPPTDDYHASTLAELRVADSLQGLFSVGDRAIASLTAAYRGTQLLTDMAADLAWGAVRGGKHADTAVAGIPERVPTPPLLLDPSPYMSRDDVIRMSVGSLIWRGFAPFYLQNLDPDTGRPRFASPIHPDEVAVNWDSRQTRPEYQWRNQTMIEGVDFAVVHMPKLPGDAKGLGPIDAARATLDGIIDANEYSRRLFSDSAVPAGYLKHPGKLTRPEAIELRKTWEETHSGGRGTGVLSGGITYETLSFTPEQAQFLLSRSFGNQDIARLLGIPAHILNAGSPPQSANSLTYTNVPAVRSELITLTLQPTYLRRIESVFSSLLPRGQSTQFDLADVLKGDERSQFEAEEIAIRAGILTVAEARARHNLDPTPAPPAPAPAVLIGALDA